MDNDQSNHLNHLFYGTISHGWKRRNAWHVSLFHSSSIHLRRRVGYINYSEYPPGAFTFFYIYIIVLFILLKIFINKTYYLQLIFILWSRLYTYHVSLRPSLPIACALSDRPFFPYRALEHLSILSGFRRSIPFLWLALFYSCLLSQGPIAPK